MAEGGATETPVQLAPKPKGKATKIIAIVIALVIMMVIILVLALYGQEWFKIGTTTPPPTSQQQPPADNEMIYVGTPSATATLSEDGAIGVLLEKGLVEDNQIGYVFCEQLDSGDKVTTSGDPDKYDVSGPVWFAYVDEYPEAWFEHDTKFIFIDASTGEEIVYSESWPPDINGEDMFSSAEDCGGATTIYST